MGGNENSKDTKHIFILLLLLPIMVVTLYILGVIGVNQMTNLGDSVDESINEYHSERDTELLNTFKYIGEVDYVILGKKVKSNLNWFNGKKNYYYYLTVKDGNNELELNVSVEDFNAAEVSVYVEILSIRQRQLI